MQSSGEGLPFKFRFIRNNSGTTIFSQKAEAREDTLQLGDACLAYDNIAESAARDNRLILIPRDPSQLDDETKKHREGDVLILEISKISVQELKRFIDRQCSKGRLEARMVELTEQGKAELFRAEICPDCGAAIDLCELDETRYIHCPFCESVLEKNGTIVTKGSEYCICDECQMFDRIKGYTIFYFYFLLYLWGYSYRRQFLCANCTKWVFWKMLFCNFLFILGIPHTIILKVKSLRGIDPELKQLGRANALAQRGKMEDAHGMFDDLLQRYPEHPGLLYNQGMGYLKANDGEQAVAHFSKAVESCANYTPAIGMLLRISAFVQDSQAGIEQTMEETAEASS